MFLAPLIEIGYEHYCAMI